jgi:hypothetical protein
MTVGIDETGHAARKIFCLPEVLCPVVVGQTTNNNLRIFIIVIAMLLVFYIVKQK